MKHSLHHLLKRLQKINQQRAQEIINDLRDQPHEMQRQRQQLSIPPFLALNASQKSS